MIDDHWDDIDGLEFCPWVGPNYEKSVFEIRILVMGESTYLGSNETEEQYQSLRGKDGLAYFINHDVLAYRDGKWTAGFWTKWINCLFGQRTASLSERQLMLDNVAYWNYADGPPLGGHSTYPRDDDLRRANAKLRKVITKLEPDLVILMSSRLWHNLSEGDDRFATDPNAAQGTVCQDQAGDVKFSFLSIRHPRRFQERDCCAIRRAIEGLGGHQPGRQGTSHSSEAAPPKSQGDPSDAVDRQPWHTLLDAILDAGHPNASAAIEHLLKYFEASAPPPEEPRA